MKRNLGVLLFLLTAVLLTGCVNPGGTPKGELAEQAELVWPSAPHSPRIKYLYSVTQPKDMLAARGWFRKMVDFLRGAKRQDVVNPYGLEVDQQGRLYVVDTAYKAIHVFDTPSGKHYLFPEKPIDGFVHPLDIALGSDQRIYVSDSGSNRVHVFSDHGKTYLRSIGQQQIGRPTGMTVNQHTGELLVLDTTRSQLLAYDEHDLSLKRIVGQEGETSEGFHYPTNITTSSDGAVYITDSLNYRVQKLAPDLTFEDHFGDAGDSPGHFSRPKGIATDSDQHVYVVDALFDNVQIFDSDGQLLLAFGTSGSGRGQFWLPNAIRIDQQDRIYVSDSQNHRVQVFQYLKEKVEQP